MEQVKAFNVRLIQAEERIKNGVSAVSIFESLEASTAQAVSLQSFALKRVEDETFLLTAEVNTDTFDSALFQRGLYERNSIIENVSFEDLSLGTTDSEEDAPRSGVSFRAELEVPLTAVPYMPEGTALPLTETTVVEISTSTEVVSTSTEPLENEDNQSGI